MPNNEILPTKLAIEPFRDNGYKNTDTAIAELIDNSIQSGLENNTNLKVDIICIEKLNDALKKEADASNKKLSMLSQFRMMYTNTESLKRLLEAIEIILQNKG